MASENTFKVPQDVQNLVNEIVGTKNGPGVAWGTAASYTNHCFGTCYTQKQIFEIWNNDGIISLDS